MLYITHDLALRPLPRRPHDGHVRRRTRRGRRRAGRHGRTPPTPTPACCCRPFPTPNGPAATTRSSAPGCARRSSTPRPAPTATTAVQPHRAGPPHRRRERRTAPLGALPSARTRLRHRPPRPEGHRPAGREATDDPRKQRPPPHDPRPHPAVRHSRRRGAGRTRPARPAPPPLPLHLARRLAQRPQRAEPLERRLPPLLPVQPARRRPPPHPLGPRHQYRPRALGPTSQSPWCPARTARTATAAGPVSWWTTGECRRSSTRAGTASIELPCVARGSADLRYWTKDPANPVITAPPEGVDITAFRDHCVWREGRAVWRQLVGSGIRGVGGTAFLYESDDLRSWRYVGPLLIGDASQNQGELDWTGTMWECVDLFRSIEDGARRPGLLRLGRGHHPPPPVLDRPLPGRHLHPDRPPPPRLRRPLLLRPPVHPRRARPTHHVRLAPGGPDGRGERAGRLVRRDVPAEGRHARHGRQPAPGPGA